MVRIRNNICKELPFLRLFFGLFLGILIEQSYSIHFNHIITIHAVCITIFILIKLLKIEWMWKISMLLSFVIVVYVITWGSITSSLLSDLKKKTTSIDNCYLLKIEESKTDAGKNEKWIATVYTRSKNKWNFRGNTYLYINKNIHGKSSIGDLLLSNQPVSIIKKIHNPGEFDFHSYSKINGTFYTIYFNDRKDYINIGNSLTKASKIILHSREFILSTLKTYIQDKQVLGIAEAMLIGYKNDIDPELNKTYTNAGVSHVIAISGMHLGLIYMLINQVFQWIFRKKHLKLIALLITLPALWFFAFLSGASASVMRSVIMFSFIIIGNHLSKSSEALNALFGAGFLMMAVDPETIYDMGFQLSFTAVLSILLFYHRIRKLMYTKNLLLQKGWSFVALSISAQLLTTPLLIYHFQHYPTYSILNNLVIVPVSSIALIAEIMVCINPIDLLNSAIISKGITTCIIGMSSFASIMNTLPFASISFPVMSLQTIAIKILLLYCLFCYFIKKSKQLMLLICLLVLLDFIFTWKEQMKIDSLQRMIVLNMKDAGAIIHQHGRHADIYIYGNWKENKMFNEKRIKNIAKHCLAQDIQYKQLDRHPLILQTNKSGKAVLLMGDDLYGAEAGQLLKRKPEWIVDGSTKLWKIRRWKKEAQNLHLRLLHTAEAGPIYLDCKDYHSFFRKK